MPPKQQLPNPKTTQDQSKPERKPRHLPLPNPDSTQSQSKAERSKRQPASLFPPRTETQVRPKPESKPKSFPIVVAGTVVVVNVVVMPRQPHQPFVVVEIEAVDVLVAVVVTAEECLAPPRSFRVPRGVILDSSTSFVVYFNVQSIITGPRFPATQAKAKFRTPLNVKPRALLNSPFPTSPRRKPAG